MVRNAEALRPGDTQLLNGTVWTVEAAEMQDGMVQVLWRATDDRKWDEYPPGTPLIVTALEAVKRVRAIKNAANLVVGDRRVSTASPPYEIVAVENTSGRVVVEWSNGSAIRVTEHDPFAGVLVQSRALVR